jgi:hypothetical protein
MGDADEGTECFAILVGEGFGHKAKVISCVSTPVGGTDYRHFTHAMQLWSLAGPTVRSKYGLCPNFPFPTLALSPHEDIVHILSTVPSFRQHGSMIALWTG